jgi:D-3-phosphoglycerate dehydrogenase
VTSQKTILVTGPYLDSDAVALAAEHGFAVVHTPAYPSTDTLRAHLAEHAPFGVVSRMGRFEGAAMDAGPGLRVIAKHGAGVDNIDVAAATERGILVTRAAGGNAVSVAEHAVAMIMAAVKRVVPMDKRLRDGHWDKPTHVGRELRGMRVGLVGSGAIGTETVKLCQAIGMSVGIYDPYAPANAFADLGVTRFDSLEGCLGGSDVVSLHCPLTSETRHLLNARTIGLMPKGSYLVNTARGGLIDEAALKDALDRGHLAGAALDTFETEPPKEHLPLFDCPNAIVTPHVAGVTAEAGRRVGLMAVESIIAIADGAGLAPARMVNADVLAEPAPSHN